MRVATVYGVLRAVLGRVYLAVPWQCSIVHALQYSIRSVQFQ
jgi:hypothetical protein